MPVLTITNNRRGKAKLVREVGRFFHSPPPPYFIHNFLIIIVGEREREKEFINALDTISAYNKVTP